MRANAVQAVHEGLDAAVEGLERKGGDEVGLLREAEGAQEGKDAVGAHELCAVEQGQTLFAHQLNRRPAELVEHTDGLALLAFIIHVADADERQEEVGQRGEVARGTQRAAVVDDGHDVVVEEVEDTLHGDHLHATVP